MKIFNFIFIFSAVCLTAVYARRQGRIVGGDIVNIENAPFIVALEYLDKQICGGAILNKNWAITASHCFGKIFLTSQAIIRSGSGLRGTGGKTHSLQNLLKHPQFVLKVNDNDVALMEVYPRFEYSSIVAPIGLPQLYSRPQVGNFVNVYGWGYTKEEGDPSSYLRSVSLPIFPQEECAKIYRTTLNVTWQMVCAGYRDGGRDACVLDSGGPMVWNGALQGLVSWGYGCARAFRPGVYTDLSAPQVRNWILSIIWK